MTKYCKKRWDSLNRTPAQRNVHLVNRLESNSETFPAPPYPTVATCTCAGYNSRFWPGNRFPLCARLYIEYLLLVIEVAIDESVNDGGLAHWHISQKHYLVLDIAEAGAFLAMNHQLLSIYLKIIAIQFPSSLFLWPTQLPLPPNPGSSIPTTKLITIFSKTLLPRKCFPSTKFNRIFLRKSRLPNKKKEQRLKMFDWENSCKTRRKR